MARRPGARRLPQLHQRRRGALLDGNPSSHAAVESRARRRPVEPRGQARFARGSSMGRALSRATPKAVFVSLPASPGFLINDPAHAPFGAVWLRGITPVRLAALAAVCMMVAASVTMSDVFRGNFSAFNWLLNALGHFSSAIVMFVLIVKVDIRTIRSRPRLRLAALGLAGGGGGLACLADRW